VSAAEPASHLTLEPGTGVQASDGERLGTVEHVLTDEATGIFEGLVVDTRLGPGGHRFVDATDVAELRADLVVLTPSATLHEPSGGPAVMEHHGVEDSESPLEHKLRRAWEIISGKG
jgi:uncharacterized protein YrrD